MTIIIDQIKQDQIRHAWITTRAGLAPGIATCSCGLKTYVVFVEARNPEKSRYMAEIKSWKFRTRPVRPASTNPHATSPESPELPGGWYCGKDGHYQADYTTLDAFPQIERPREL